MSNKSLAKSPDNTTVLLTGGAGFIGSHTCVELLNSGYRVVIVDDLSNSCQAAIKRIRTITQVNDDRLVFYRANILDREALTTIFSENNLDAIIHFAGFKAVGESTQKPLEYHQAAARHETRLAPCPQLTRSRIFQPSIQVLAHDHAQDQQRECSRAHPLHQAFHSHFRTL